MKKQKKNLIWICIFALLVLLQICFIFSNSANSKSESVDKSVAVSKFVKPILDPQNQISDSVFHHYIRKAAHFSEFAALGFSLMGLSDCLPWKEKNKQRLAMPLSVCLLVAVVDETIQVFAPSRGPGIKDVLLDFCGAVFGILCMAVLLMLISRPKNKK